MFTTCLILLAVLTVLFGPQGFIAGLFTLICNLFWYSWKALEVLDFIGMVFDFLNMAFHVLGFIFDLLSMLFGILSLFG